MNNFQRVQLLYHEAGSWLERDFFSPNKVDVKIICNALVDFARDGKDKKKMCIDGERWRQIMRLIIGWHSDLLDTQPIILASCIDQANKSIDKFT